MIRPLTLICMVLFLFAGFYDYQTTHRVDQIDQQIASTREAAAAARSDTKVLQTEWSWLNRPDRLQPFAAEFLSLQQITPTQYVPFDQLAEHLPAPGPPPAAVPAPLPATTLASAASVSAPAQPGEVKLAEATSPVRIRVALPPTESAAATSPNRPAPVASVAEAVAPIANPVGPGGAPSGEDPSLSSIERSLQADASARSTQSALGEAQPAAPRPVKYAAAPMRSAPRPTLAYRAAVIAPRAATALPAPGTVLVADNDQAREPAAPHSLSALGMAQSTPSLPAPVAVSDTAWRDDQ